jgi:hypothetical protein
LALQSFNGALVFLAIANILITSLFIEPILTYWIKKQIKLSIEERIEE